MKSRTGASTAGETCTRGFLTEIESVRGIAALAVAKAHLAGFVIPFFFLTSVAPVENIPAIVRYIGWLIYCLVNANTAVVVFFVISGLVIGRALDLRKQKLSLGGYCRFLLRRGLRIYPAHTALLLFALAFAATVVVRMPPIDLDRFPAAVRSALPWYSGDFLAVADWRTVLGNLVLANWTLNPVTWSLQVEMLACLVLPFFHVASRSGRAGIDLAMIVTLCAFGFACVARFEISFVVYYLVAFYVGLSVETWGRRWAAIVNRRICSSGIAIGCSYFLMLLPERLLGGRSPLIIDLEVFAAFSLLSLIVWGERGRVTAVLNHRVLRFVGRVSYSVYLWHALVILVATRLLYSFKGPLASIHQFATASAVMLACIAAIIGITLTLSSLTYRYVERPFIRLGQRLSRSSGPSAAAARVFGSL